MKRKGVETTWLLLKQYAICLERVNLRVITVTNIVYGCVYLSNVLDRNISIRNIVLEGMALKAYFLGFSKQNFNGSTIYTSLSQRRENIYS